MLSVLIIEEDAMQTEEVPLKLDSLKYRIFVMPLTGT